MQDIETNDNEWVSMSQANSLLGKEPHSAVLLFWKAAGRVKNYQQGPAQDARHKATHFFLKEEILRIREQQLDFLTHTQGLMSFTELRKQTCLTSKQVYYYIQTKEFPNVIVKQGEKNRLFFKWPDVLEWLIKAEGPNFRAEDLLSFNQACQVTGLSRPTLNKYILTGQLRFFVFQQTVLRAQLKSPQSAKIGQGYWFKKEEIDRFKSWWDSAKQDRGINNEGAGYVNPYPSNGEIASERPEPIMRVPRLKIDMTDEERNAFFGDKLKSGEDSKKVVRLLETRILSILRSGIPVGPQDIYHLTNACRLLKRQWKLLKEAGVELESNDGEVPLEILGLLQQKLLSVLGSGIGLSGPDLSFLSTAQNYIQAEYAKMEEEEIGNTGLSSDELFKEAVGS